MHDPTQVLSDSVRLAMTKLAKVLNNIFGNALKPSYITALSFIGHLPIAWALYDGRTYLAAYLLIVFGLMDALDGALARVQNSASLLGVFFDSVTDRFKEVILYAALGAYAAKFEPTIQPWVVAAVAGTSLLVPYIRARGEAVLASHAQDPEKLNRVFTGGFGRYEVRMFFVIVGLLTNQLAPLLHLIIALNLATSALRFTQAGQAIGNLKHTVSTPHTKSGRTNHTGEKL